MKIIGVPLNFLRVRARSAAVRITPEPTDDKCPTCGNSGHRIEDCEKNEELRFQSCVNDPRLQFNKVGVYNPGGEGKTLRVRLHRNLKPLREILKND